MLRTVVGLVALLLLMLLQGLGVARGKFFQSFRRDYYLSDKDYPELFADDPVYGGRVHLVLDAETGIDAEWPLTVVLSGDGDDIAQMIDSSASLQGALDWMHADYNAATGQLVVSFHAHDDETITDTSSVVVTDASGVELASSDHVSLSAMVEEDGNNAPVQITYVTSRNAFSQLIVHVHNYDDSRSHTLQALYVNGQESDAVEGSMTIPAGEHRVFTVSVSMAEGAAWTAGIVLADGDSAASVGFGGRLGKELYVLEDWPKSSQCPFPNVDEENYELLRDTMHLNTRMIYGSCGDDNDIAQSAADSGGEFYVLASEDQTGEADSLPSSAFPGVASMFLGDEIDTGLDACEPNWQDAVTRRKYYGSLLGYYGGHTHKYNGAFAGMTDLQGMDFYVAACAPHVTATLSTMHLQGSYDYLYNTRQNHKPLTAWGYAQAYCTDCWPTTMESGEVVNAMASAIAAGMKGVMLFESDVRLSDDDSWTAGGDFMSSIAQAGELLRQGDVEGALFTTTDERNSSITQIVRAPDNNLLMVVVSMDASDYNDLVCYLHRYDHWQFEDHSVDLVNVTIPADIAGEVLSGEYETVEYLDGSILTPPTNGEFFIDDSTGSWLGQNIQLGTDTTARIFGLRPKMAT